MRYLTQKISFVLALAGTAPALLVNGSNANLLFVVDESGSMSGEHQFLQDQAASIESGLSTTGISNLNFGLVGYGNTDSVPRLFEMDGSNLGDAAAFSSAASSLEIDGSTEDGYAGIDFALDQFSGLTGSTFVVLVTDEDRDILDESEYPGASSLTPSSMEQALTAANARLVSIVDQQILDNQSSEALVINPDDQTFQADGSGDVERSENGSLGSRADGDTTVDYAELALATGGIVADLEQLREGGDTADSFTIAFIDSLVNIVLISTGGIFEQLAENENQRAFAAVVVSAIQEPDSTNEFFVEALKLDPAQQKLLLRLAELQEMTQVGDSLIGGAFSYTFAMEDHFTVTSRKSRSLRATEDPENVQFRKWNGFFQAAFNDADISATSSSVEGDSDNYGGLVGFDYRWDTDLVTGLALGYKDDEIDYGNYSESEIETTSILAYTSWMPVDGLSFEGTLGYARSDIDTFRRTTLVGASSNARGDTDADTVSASIGARYAFDVQSFTVTPFARLQWAQVDIDGYDEKGGGALSAMVEDHDVDSVQSILGFRASMDLTMGDFQVIPHLGAEWVHQFEDEGTLVDTTVSGNSFELTTNTRDEDFGRVNLGATLELDEDTSVMLSGVRSVGNDFIDNTSVRFSIHRAF
ncbi:MAG: autotransporter domain-containing protein [Opitutales bacterium]